MALSSEMIDFCTSWLQKAYSYVGNNLNDYYDKAFTLFTLYNRLYSEATFTLARQRKVQIKKNRAFPDRKGATIYAPQFIGYDNLLKEFQNDNSCSISIDTMIKLLENQCFFVKLSMPFGDPQPESDFKLLSELKSRNQKIKITAIMDFIYSVRCNMFHGNKGFEPVQVEVLEPIIIILRKIIVVLYNKLKEYSSASA